MKREFRYWCCQILGWGSWCLFVVLITYKYSKDYFLSPIPKRNLFLYEVCMDFLCFIVFTHLLRLILKKLNWINFSSTKIFFTFLVGIFLTSLACFYATKNLSKLPKVSFENYINEEQKNKAIGLEKDMLLDKSDYFLYENAGVLDSAKYASFQKIKKSTSWYRNKKGEWVKEEKKGRDLGGLINTAFLVALWSLMYIAWHYVINNRKEQLDKLRLEGLVKSLELKTIKSHINPHFIFNALNSIRALVDENPPRARTAITELSNILRSSLQAEVQETVPLEQELEIVKDYLALEHMRFEERLTIKMEIAPDTLNQPIPPMMLQNLVENAIKHGISKQVYGGTILVKSLYVQNEHHLIVQNPGILIINKTKINEGFGLKSTQDRLNLLYHKKATFEIVQLENAIVQSKIVMPKLSYTLTTT